MTMRIGTSQYFRLARMNRKSSTGRLIMVPRIVVVIDTGLELVTE